MPWNPEIYNQYKDIRYKPFYDLLAFIEEKDNFKGIDLGCGTGEQAAIITHRFKGAHILGVDSSAEMLEKANEFENSRLHFKLEHIEDVINSDNTWDLVFSNAALQWVDDHEKLFPKIIGLLNPGGQLAIQMPVQNENLLNQILLTLVQEEPYANHLGYYVRKSPVLSIDDYAQILFQCGMEDLEISQKVYPIIAENTEELYEFISGSALIPYVERLDPELKKSFIKEFKKRIQERFTKFPAIYAFKRLLIYGKLAR